MRVRSIIVALAVLSAPCVAAAPPPGTTPAQTIVSGRTSTLKNVKITPIGTEIPLTYSGKRIKNTPGFSWYVSRHYALKTDYTPQRARFYLTLLEMAYPHYVALLGREPPGIDTKRMAVVYASSAERLRQALASDGLQWDFRGGGITFEGCRCAYQYPSGSLRYHQRYILLHECTHLYQMCLTGTTLNTPWWFYEGIAEALASLVYEEKKRRLTLDVMDKATTINLFDQGLRQYRGDRPTFSQIHAKAKGPDGRGLAFLMVQFFRTDPDRRQRFRIFRDEMFRRNLRGKHVDQLAGRLLQDLFGPWPKIDAEFRTWVDGLQNTFHYAEWGWEQDGNTLWSYGFAPGGKLSRTDIHLSPGHRPRHDPLRMDYPAVSISPLVGEVRRGTAEPAVGAVLDFSRNPGRGLAGIGLGLVDGRPVTPFDAGSLFVDREGKTPGLRVAAYHKGIVIDSGRRSEDVKNARLIREAVEPNVALGLVGSVTEGLKRDFVVEWTGYLKVRRAGRYVFALASDDGSWLWIDGRQTIDNGGLHARTVKTGAADLSAGMHAVRIRYFQGLAEASLTAGYAPRVPGGCLRILVSRGRELILDGTDLHLPRIAVPIDPAFRLALRAGGHRLGLHARIARHKLVVTLRARDPKAAAAATLVATMPVPPRQRLRLLRRGGTLLARDGYHGLTPFFDDRRILRTDYDTPAAPNRWRFPGDRALYRLYRAEWRLGDRAPHSLKALKALLLSATDKSPPIQNHAVAAFGNRIPAVRADIKTCGAGPDRIAQALAELESPPPREGETLRR